MQYNASMVRSLLVHISRLLLPVWLFAMLGCRSTQPYQSPLSKAAFHPNGKQIAFTVAQRDACYIYVA
ncbi:MAG: hypothetical protein V4734_03990, partial [Terriglobus sp.]